MAAVRPANVAGSDVVHSSGSPALRRPSNAFGTFGECAIAHLTVRLGLRRRASAKADFASSILPVERVGGGEIGVRYVRSITGFDRLVDFVDRGVVVTLFEFRIADQEIAKYPFSDRADLTASLAADRTSACSKRPSEVSAMPRAA